MAGEPGTGGAPARHPPVPRGQEPPAAALAAGLGPVPQPAKMNSRRSLPRGREPQDWWGLLWARPRVPPSPCLCHPRARLDPGPCSMASATGGRIRPRAAQPRHGSLAAWLPPRIATLALVHSSAKKTGASLSREPQETWHSNLPAPAPASPWHPGTASPQAPLGTGRPGPAARQLSPGDVPSPAGTVWGRVDAQGSARSSPGRVGCLCHRGRSPRWPGGLPGKHRFPRARLVLHSAGPGQCEEVA